jgi:RND superfamily putative drug exporter
MFNLLGRLVIDHAWKICAGWVVVAVALLFIAPAWETKAQDDDIRFLPERCASVRGFHLLEKAFPDDVFASKAAFTVERPGQRLTPADFTLVDQLVADLEKLRQEQPALQIGSIHSYTDLAIGSRLTSADGQCTLIQVALQSPYLAERTRATVDRAEERLRRRMKAAGPGAPKLFITGTAGIGRDMNKACADSLEGTTLATVILVIVILMFVYRAPLLALVPLLTIAVSVVVSLKLLAFMTLLPGVHLVNISKVFAIVILYGAGTDYCLFLISRYQENLEGGHDGATAIRRSIGSVGGALTASAGTVMCGLGLMVFAEFAKVRFGGPAIAISLGVALLAALTLAPALLHLLGALAFWPRGVPHSSARAARTGSNPGFWSWVSHRVVARPVLVWTVAFVALLPLAIFGTQVGATYRATGELPPTSSSLKGLTAIQKHFNVGEIGPVTVMLVSPTSWDSPAGRATIEHVSRSFAFMDNVAEVRSLTQPLGKPMTLAAPAPAKPTGLLGRLFQVAQPGLDKIVKDARTAAVKHYVGTVAEEDGPKSVTRLDVVMKSDPFVKASVNTLELMRTFLRNELEFAPLPPGGVRTECYGVTLGSRDLAAVTEGDRVRVNCLVLAGIFLILFYLVRKPWLAAYLLATVLFSYFVTLGATALAGTVWSGRPLHTMDWRVPFFLFTILVAVGEDYNILLVTRALQERLKHGPVEGIRRALARTGGTITSCGLIMAGTFATLMLAGLGTLKQIGFALAFGVLLDTFVVRPFLVPAFMLIIWRRQQEGEEMPAPKPRPLPFSMRKAA